MFAELCRISPRASGSESLGFRGAGGKALFNKHLGSASCVPDIEGGSRTPPGSCLGVLQLGEVTIHTHKATFVTAVVSPTNDRSLV